MASVIGREFDFNLLRRLDQAISEEQWLEGIDEGVAAHLIGEVPEEIDHYRFSHALIQQSLSEELTTSRRVRPWSVPGCNPLTTGSIADL